MLDNKTFRAHLRTLLITTLLKAPLREVVTMAKLIVG